MPGVDAVGSSSNDRVSGRGVSRRTVMKGAAWSVPVIMLANAAPAFAASPINLGNILESSCTINDQTVTQTSMFIAGNNVPGAGTITDVELTFTVTIKYTRPGSSSSFTLDGTTVTGNGFTGQLGSPVFSSSSGVETLTFTMTVTGTIDGTGWKSGTGSVGYVANFPNKLAPDGVNRVQPEDGSIRVDAVVTGTDAEGNQYHAQDLIMGEQGSTTGPMLDGNGHTIPLVGPYFHKP